MRERGRMERELLELGTESEHEWEPAKPDAKVDARLSKFLLCGPIVRRATRDVVWFWLASKLPVTGVSANFRLVGGLPKGGAPLQLERRGLSVRVNEYRTIRVGARLFAVLVSVVPSSGAFPTDVPIEYDLALTTDTGTASKRTWISTLGMGIAYSPYQWPTFMLANRNRRIAHGSCRRPGAKAEDAFEYLDRWIAERAGSNQERPASLILTGDQIYADDVALSLFEGVRKLAMDLFGYDEKLPKPKSNEGAIAAVHYGWAPETGQPSIEGVPLPPAKGPDSVRRRLTHRTMSPIGFTTEDGERHLMTLPEYAAMYLLAWNPELSSPYAIEGQLGLNNFRAATRAARRVLANTPTYMLCDDHEITDDWNLDKQWEQKTKANALARRIITNGLAAYWIFQAWGNDPSQYDKQFVQDLQLYFDQLHNSGGHPRSPQSRSPIRAVEVYETRLLETNWSFVAPTIPKALCVDTRTGRDPSNSTDSDILLGSRTKLRIEQLARSGGLEVKRPLLVVLPTPLLPHYSMMTAQSTTYAGGVIAHTIRSTETLQRRLHAKRYEAEFELFGNNPRQRAELILFLKEKLNPPVVVVFSGDVHHGSVVSGRYAYGKSRAEIEKGRGEWAMGIVQITSSPIKNEKDKAFREKRAWTFNQTDAGNVAEEIKALYEHRFMTPDKGKSHVAMQATVRYLKGALGRETYVFEPHFCIVDLPVDSGGKYNVRFVGEKNRKVAEATTAVSSDNDPRKFLVEFVPGSNNLARKRPKFD